MNTSKTNGNAHASVSTTPNFVFILADDRKTVRDKMATEGLFLQTATPTRR